MCVVGRRADLGRLAAHAVFILHAIVPMPSIFDAMLTTSRYDIRLSMSSSRHRTSSFTRQAGGTEYASRMRDRDSGERGGECGERGDGGDGAIGARLLRGLVGRECHDPGVPGQKFALVLGRPRASCARCLRSSSSAR